MVPINDFHIVRGETRKRCTKRRYNVSDKAKAMRKSYKRSPKGRIGRALAHARVVDSGLKKVYDHKYYSKLENRERRRERARRRYLKIKSNPEEYARLLENNNRGSRMRRERKKIGATNALNHLNALVGVTAKTPIDPKIVAAVKRRNGG